MAETFPSGKARQLWSLKGIEAYGKSLAKVNEKQLHLMGYKAQNVSVWGRLMSVLPVFMCFPSKTRWMLAINSVVTIS